MNASACHRDISGTVVTMNGYGYRALSNYQKSLKDAMRAALKTRDMTARVIKRTELEQQSA